MKSREHTADLSAYEGVEETIVHQLSDGRWFAAVRCRVKKRGAGHGIGDIEDLHRRFKEEKEARGWVADKVAAIEGEKT